MVLKAVFLDLGGTLIDLESDRKAHREMIKAFQSALDLQGHSRKLFERYQARREELIEKLGTRWSQEQNVTRRVVATVLQEEGIPMREEHWEAFQRAYWDEHERWVELYPGVGRVLQGLRDAVLHIGLISDVDEDFLQLCLFKFPLEPYMDSITTSEEVGFAKPHEAIFRRALSKARCRTAEAVYVGDSPEKDVVGAAGVGMRSILIGRDDEAGADYTVEDLEGAYEVVLRLMEEGTA